MMVSGVDGRNGVVEACPHRTRWSERIIWMYAHHDAGAPGRGPIGGALEKPSPITEHQWPDDAVPLVSIICPTYNHARFIGPCLDGFLSQETAFPVEILVHDDASTDGTAAIVRAYRDRYPHLIRATLQRENQYSRGVHVADAMVRLARGRYVATCEGDDYWISPTKLQRQVEVLEGHPDCLLCGARTFVHRDGAATPHAIEPRVPVPELGGLDPTDIIYEKWYLKTASRVFRRALWMAYLDAIGPAAPSGDWLFTLYGIARAQAEAARFYCLDEVVAVYREHAGGVWSGLDEKKRLRKSLSALAFALSHFRFTRGRYRLYRNLVHLCLLTRQVAPLRLAGSPLRVAQTWAR